MEELEKKMAQPQIRPGQAAFRLGTAFLALVAVLSRFQFWARSRLGDLAPPRSRLDHMKEGLLQEVVSFPRPSDG